MYFSGNATGTQLRAPYSSYKRANGPVDKVVVSAQYRDSLEEQDFVQKVSRFEYLTHGSNGNGGRPTPPLNRSPNSSGGATSPPVVRSPPLGGVTYLHASPPGGVNVNGNVGPGEQGLSQQHGNSSGWYVPSKKAATTTISVVLKSSSANEGSDHPAVVENGKNDPLSVPNDSVREDTKGVRPRPSLSLAQRPPSPSGPISPIKSVQHKTISFKHPPTTVTTSGNYASSSPHFAQTVAKSPPSPSLTRRSPSPSLQRRQAPPAPPSGNKQQQGVSDPSPVGVRKFLSSPPSPTLTRKRTPTPPPRPNREAAKALEQVSQKSEPPPSPTARRKLPSSPTVTRKFPISSSPTPARRGIAQTNGKITGSAPSLVSTGSVGAVPESPKPERKFPVTPESPKPQRKVPESPKPPRKFPVTPESPKPSRKNTTPDSPTLNRKFTLTQSSPSLQRKFPTPPESPKVTRKFPVTPESPSLTRKFPITPESPKPQRKVIPYSPEADRPAFATKPPLSPTSPKPTRKFPVDADVEKRPQQNGDNVKFLAGVPLSPSAQRRGLGSPQFGKTSPKQAPITPPSPSSTRRNLATPPPVLPKTKGAPPPIPPHAVPLNKKSPFPKHQGEKVFTKDTAIVQRVAIPGFDKKGEQQFTRGSTVSDISSDLSTTDSRVVSGISTASSSSFTSVSSMSSTLSSETAIKRDSLHSQQSKKSQDSKPEAEMEVNANTPDSPHNGLLGGGHNRDGVAIDDLEVDLDMDDLTGSQQDLKALHDQMVAERKKEQEMAALEKQRLEEILNMCAEYERQIEQERMACGGATTMDEKFVTKEEKRDSDIKSDGSSSRPESRNSMTKIKTNGSLTMISSPGTTHKEVSFEHWRRRSSNSSASEDDLGSENGTIKRRPNNGHNLDNLIHSLNSEANQMAKDSDITDGAAMSAEVIPEKNNNTSPEVQGTGMRLQLIKIGEGAYAGPVLRSVTNNPPNASNAELTGVVTPPGSEGRSPRSPRSLNSDLRSPGDSDGDRSTRQQLATPSSSGVETSSDQSLNKIEVGEFTMFLLYI